jgi:hypothetical protein
VLSKHAQLFLSFRADMFDDFGGKVSQQKQRSKAAYEATEVMLSSIVRAKLLADARLGKASTAARSSSLPPVENTASVSPEAFLRDATSVLLIDSDVTDGTCW